MFQNGEATVFARLTSFAADSGQLCLINDRKDRPKRFLRSRQRLPKENGGSNFRKLILDKVEPLNGVSS